MSLGLNEMEEQALYETDSSQVPPQDIVAYNELRSCADLFRMHEQKILDIQPEFQRDVVWTSPDQTRFIDSLIKQLPIPSMCFALDYKDQKWIVIDGLQRISTIIKFLEGGAWRLSQLDDIDQNISGKSVATIKTSKDSLHEYYTRVENLTLPITVLRCNFSKASHLEYLFTIFHRLNTGGMKLNNQEIRNCIYGGKFNSLLRALDSLPAWRRINKMRGNNTYRFAKQELILRFFAFMDDAQQYTGHLANFLNSYMLKHRNPTDQFLNDKKSVFERTVLCIDEQIFDKKAPPKTPNTILEALLVGVGSNIDLLGNIESHTIRYRYEYLIGHESFSESSLKEGLSKKQKVKDRLVLATNIFSGNF